jgi:hypothetical protein
MDGLSLTWNYYFYCKQQLLLLLFLQSFNIYILHTLTILVWVYFVILQEGTYGSWYECGSLVCNNIFCESRFKTSWYWQVFLEWCLECSEMITIKTVSVLWWCTVLKNRYHTVQNLTAVDVRHPCEHVWNLSRTTIWFLGLNLIKACQCLYCRNSHLQASLLYNSGYSMALQDAWSDMNHPYI